MMICRVTALVLAASAASAAPPDLDRYDLVWSTPSGSAAGSMPIGNGTFGANVWVDERGDLLLLLSRTDAWSETDRLLKLGRVRIHLDPSPFTPGAPFTQRLKLSDGRIDISGGAAGEEAALRIYFNMFGSDLRIEGDLKKPRTVTASLESWRTEKRTLENDDELRSSWTMHSAPADLRRELAWESPDVLATHTDNLRSGVLWYHRNEHSIVPFTLKHQGLTPIKDQFHDPLLRRTFGGFMEGIAGSGLALSKDAPATLVTPAPVPWFGVKITTHTAQTDTVDAWKSRVIQLGAPLPGPDGTRVQTAAWWSAFWDRSWIFVSGDASSAAMKPVPVNTHPLRLGADSHGRNLFRGWMNRASVYHRPLAPGEIAALAATRASRDRPALEGGEISADLEHAALITDGAAWRCINSFGESCAWQPEGLLESVTDTDRPVAQFSGGYLRTIPQRTLNFEKGLTLEAWIRPQKDLGPARIFDKLTAGTSDGFLFDTHPGDSLRLIVGDLTLSAPGVLKKNQWQHVAATFDPQAGRGVIYLNGKAVAESGPRGPWTDDANPAPSRLTQAYTLQRWVQACGGGSRLIAAGDYPIKFNGSIFTVEPAPTQGQPFNPDWRKWGGCFWWQNTRLPYYPMLASGDFDMMEPLFGFHERLLPAAKARTALYYNAKGVYWPETMTSFGTYANGDYGWNREGVDASDIQCPWWQWAWNQSLELTQLMLDRAAYTGDDQFLLERALPMARETLLYFDSRFKRDAQGFYVITPTQSVETYWHDVVGDAPVIGGLRTISAQLCALSPKIGTKEDRELWERIRASTPPLPTFERNGKRLASPAQKYKDQRNNCETPELYPLWPFREYDLARPENLEAAQNAYPARVDKSTVGWTQDGIFAARLGLTEEARTNLLAHLANSNAAHRFPVMWGPNFDWLPDQCHGSNVLTQTQLMLMQADTLTDKILLLPAWPRGWDVSFKLHAPKQTVVECVYRDGKVEKIEVQPASRRADIVLPKDLLANSQTP